MSQRTMGPITANELGDGVKRKLERRVITQAAKDITVVQRVAVKIAISTLMICTPRRRTCNSGLGGRIVSSFPLLILLVVGEGI